MREQLIISIKNKNKQTKRHFIRKQTRTTIYFWEDLKKRVAYQSEICLQTVESWRRPQSQNLPILLRQKGLLTHYTMHSNLDSQYLADNSEY